MRVIRLCHGTGDGVSEACLVTASNMLIGKGENLDENSCVCPAIRIFAIHTNDSIPVEILGKLYGDLAWEILGTWVDDVETLRRRAFYIANWVIKKVFVPGLVAYLPTNKYNEVLSQLRDLPEIVDKELANRAADLLDVLGPNGPAAILTAEDAVGSAINAADFDHISDVEEYATAAAGHAAICALEIYKRLDNDRGRFIWPECREAILGMAAIGDKRPQEVVLTRDELYSRLCVGQPSI